MDAKFSSLKNGNRNSDDLPPVGKDVTVMHEGRKRTAYRDTEGNWRDFHNGNILLGDVRMLKND